MKFATFLTFGVLIAGSVLAVDTLTLKDGQVVTGDILEETERDIRIVTAEETIRIPRWAIEKIERDDTETTAADAMTRRPGAGRPQTRRPRTEEMRTGVEPTKALVDWIDTCIEKLASEDRGVRFSATAALRSVGDAAKPALEEAAAGDDAEVAQVALALLGRGKPRRGGSTGTENLAMLLNLTGEQKVQVARIFEELRTSQHEAATAVRSGDADSATLNDTLKALREEADRKLASVLSDTQMQQYREMRQGG